jgi:putative flippase GtrA
VIATGWRVIAARWVKFNVVGGVGIAVQLAALAGFRSALHLDYRLATAFAVEAAVIHNFFWHQRFTWVDRPEGKTGKSLLRLARFNLTTGALSILGNLAAMQVLVGIFGMAYLVANAVAIAACSIVNFLVSDRFVFSNP